jgi:hypothetical protein
MQAVNMNKRDRRHFLTSTVGAAAAATRWIGTHANAANPPRERIKVGQIGIGHNHASAKMATFRKLKDQYEVVGVVESDLEWLKKRATRSGVPRPGLDDRGAVAQHRGPCGLWQWKPMSAIWCHGRTLHRRRDASALGQTGRRVARGVQDLLDQAGRQGLTVQMGYMYRNNPAVQFCLRAVREGWLGDVFEVHGVMSRWTEPPIVGGCRSFRAEPCSSSAAI